MKVSLAARINDLRQIRPLQAWRSLLREKPDILPLLNNREALRAMPRDSVGRAYLRFVEARDLSADGLVTASEEALCKELGVHAPTRYREALAGMAPEHLAAS